MSFTVTHSSMDLANGELMVQLLEWPTMLRIRRVDINQTALVRELIEEALAAARRRLLIPANRHEKYRACLTRP